MEMEDAGNWRNEEMLMPDAFNHPGEPILLPRQVLGKDAFKLIINVNIKTMRCNFKSIKPTVFFK